MRNLKIHKIKKVCQRLLFLLLAAVLWKSFSCAAASAGEREGIYADQRPFGRIEGILRCREAGFTLKTETVHGNQVQLRWNPCTGAEGYLVLRREEADGTGVPIASLDAETFTYTEKELAPGETAYYEIAAVLPDGTSGDSSQTGVTNLCKVYLSGKPDTPAVKIEQAGRKLKFQITHLTGSEALYLYGKKKGGRYQLYSITKDSYQMFVEKDTAKFILKAQSARGTYLFRVRSYRLVKGKKKYSAYSKERKVHFA